ncbi:hypothetical protein H0H87_008336 [Tephrocybe sp. NHM501043]|nr:hypothetical protein H0H87_008336 [Tephrocybe sp. NHM501043]
MAMDEKAQKSTESQAALDISADVNLHELLKSFQECHSTVHLNLQPDFTPEELPAPPEIFVGRDDLVQSIVQPLLQSRGVALTGPGGIGKSSIARAVLNDKALAAKFQNRRVFVRFDDVGAAQVTLGTFLDRMARALGLSTVANTHHLVTKVLAMSATLLVLDNAETVLNPAGVDAGRIADVIGGFGSARPHNVAVLLTTRTTTTTLPPNLEWTRVPVPPLDEGAACAAFRMFKPPPVELPILIQLLSAVDFHPLSIRLLAHTAIQNNWSSRDLANAWGRQRTVLLETGGDRLATTIETCLHSPSVLKHGTTIVQLLQVLAYLPQGISKQRLAGVFSGVPGIEACADALCGHSLAYVNGGFITLLAPIRLYISTRYNATIVGDNPLLQKVRGYYKAHAVDEKIVVEDNVNMEHVFAHWVTDPAAMMFVLDLITHFLFVLLDCRPRPTALGGVIAGLDPTTSREPVSPVNFLRLFPTLHPRRRIAAHFKGLCLVAVSTLMCYAGKSAAADPLIAEARRLLRASGRQGRSSLHFLDYANASIYAEQGNFVAAQELFTSLLGDRLLADHLRGIVSVDLAFVEQHLGRRGTAQRCIEALRGIPPSGVNWCWSVAGAGEMNDGNLDVAKRHFEAARAAMGDEPSEKLYKTLLGQAEVAHRLGDHGEARALHARVLDSARAHRGEAQTYVHEAVAVVAAYLAMGGDVARARELSGRAVADAYRHPDVRVVRCSYLAGCVELRGGDLGKAEAYFGETVGTCVAFSQWSIRAMAERALGEIAVVRGDVGAAGGHFGGVVKLCEAMGVAGDGMYREYGCYMLSEAFEGWRLYREGHPMFRT